VGAAVLLLPVSRRPLPGLLRPRTARVLWVTSGEVCNVSALPT
jgi:hypothetical protein